MRLGHDAESFVPENGAIAFSFPFKFDRSTESSFPIIQPGKLMFVEPHLTHRSCERSIDGNEVAERNGLVLEYGPFSLNHLARLGIDHAGF